MTEIIELFVAVLVLLGAILSIAAAVGLLRFADVLTRLHAVTKPQVLGLFAMIVAIAIAGESVFTFFMLLPIFIFQALTAPVAAHMVGRAAYRAGIIAEDRIYVDELEAPVELADHDQPEQEPLA